MSASPPIQCRRPAIVFTVDVEDWGQSVFDRSLPISDYAADNVHRLLDLIAKDPTARGTFFILGKFADRHPDVVRRIAAAGHEIACHGHGHIEVRQLGRAGFRDDLRTAIDAIGKITGRRPVGYRASVFSITRDTLWALGSLIAEGFEYDSSIFPFRGRRYGIDDWPAHPTRVRFATGRSIVEYPLTVRQVAGRRWPISGGGYARLLPRRMLVRAFGHVEKGSVASPVFYCHPYEIDPREWRRPVGERTWGDRRVPLRTRLHQGIGRRGFADKLAALLRSFQFQTMSRAVSTLDAQGLLPDVPPHSLQRTRDRARPVAAAVIDAAAASG